MTTLKKALELWFSVQPLPSRDRDRLSQRFTVDYNYNSNHIEGNTLTYGQTEILLLFGKIVGEAHLRDVEEMTASNVGLKMMAEEAGIKEMPLTQNFIRTLHNVQRVEILPYHGLGAMKYKDLGIDYVLKDLESPTKERVQNAKDILEIEKSTKWKE